MAKVVKTLKNKHRDSLWLDNDGDVWFHNRHEGTSWSVVMVGDPFVEIAKSDLVVPKMKEYGPFTRLYRR